MNKATYTFLLLLASCVNANAASSAPVDTQKHITNYDLSTDRSLKAVRWPTTRPLIKSFDIAINGPVSIKITPNIAVVHDVATLTFIRNRDMQISGFIVQYSSESPLGAYADALILARLFDIDPTALSTFREEIERRGDAGSLTLSTSVSAKPRERPPVSAVVEVIHTADVAPLNLRYKIVILMRLGPVPTKLPRDARYNVPGPTTMPEHEQAGKS